MQYVSIFVVNPLTKKEGSVQSNSIVTPEIHTILSNFPRMKKGEMETEKLKIDKKWFEKLYVLCKMFICIVIVYINWKLDCELINIIYVSKGGIKGWLYHKQNGTQKHNCD